jgi:hypothetical protein
MAYLISRSLYACTNNIMLQITSGGINGHHRGIGNLDACEKNDPCQHGGICISTDSGPKCQCRDKNYEGAYCEIGMCTFFAKKTKFLSTNGHESYRR